MDRLPLQSDPRLLVGRESSDDAGVYKLTDEIALIQTIDFFTPMVNDPFEFGRIAAANALSDIYAMGGKPLTALNVVCFPTKTMDKEVLLSILQGGMEVIRQAGTLLVGGHSIEDKETKYGLSVLGTAHPDRLVTNAKAREGQVLILTKPLGTGILSTALKGRMLPPGLESEMIRIMAELNDKAARVMLKYGVETATDITGFGLLGHGLEMAQASRVKMTFRASQVPLIEGVADLARMGLIPGGSHANRKYCSHLIQVDPKVESYLVNILADAQTSGGLLMAVPADREEDLRRDLEEEGVTAARIGEVDGPGEGRIMIRP